jgi:hypothetical protein
MLIVQYYHSPPPPAIHPSKVGVHTYDVRRNKQNVVRRLRTPGEPIKNLGDVSFLSTSSIMQGCVCLNAGSRCRYLSLLTRVYIYMSPQWLNSILPVLLQVSDKLYLVYKYLCDRYKQINYQVGMQQWRTQAIQ